MLVAKNLSVNQLFDVVSSSDVRFIVQLSVDQFDEGEHPLFSIHLKPLLSADILFTCSEFDTGDFVQLCKRVAKLNFEFDDLPF